VFKTFENANSSISVINLFPHSMRWIAFLSKSMPKSCILSANACISLIESLVAFAKISHNTQCLSHFAFLANPPNSLPLVANKARNNV
jgi:hypothetical protein